MKIYVKARGLLGASVLVIKTGTKERERERERAGERERESFDLAACFIMLL